MSKVTSTPLKRLSTYTTANDFSSLYIPTITDEAEEVGGLHGRIRLRRDDTHPQAQKDLFHSRNWMDKQRTNLQAYEYLCHIGEAKDWIESCINEHIPPIVELEESMRNGIVLAKLAKWVAPDVAKKRIFMGEKLQFRHSDNYHMFFAVLEQVKLPKIFWFEFVDLYDKKNIPRVVYCIHALSHLLERLDVAPKIKNLVGRLVFTDEELSATQRGLDQAGVSMPNFSTVGYSLHRELGDDGNEDNDGLASTNDDYGSEISDFSVPQTPATPEILYDPMAYYSLPENLERVRKAQAIVRGYNHRKSFQQVQRAHMTAPKLFLANVQAQARGALARRAHTDHQIRMEDFESIFVQMQAQCRGVLTRRAFDEMVEELDSLHDWASRLQALAQGYLARKQYDTMLKRSRQEAERNVKLHRFHTTRVSDDAFRKLSNDRNPSIDTVKNFIHLLDDNNVDFDLEVEIERLRQIVIKHIREDSQIEAHLSNLDIKIALLVRNKITLDEVLRASKKMNSTQRRRMSQILASGTNQHGQSPYNLKALDKETRNRLELYQQLFYLLQTEPQYLSRLLFVINGPHGLSDKHRKMAENVILTLFGYAQDAREEYLMLKLFRSCIWEEVKAADSIQEFLKGNYIFIKLGFQVNRGVKEQRYLRDTFGELVTKVITDDFLSLETNPVSIYKAAYQDEESRTGKTPDRPFEVNPQQAMAYKPTRSTFIKNLQTLRRKTEDFLTAILQSLNEMPFGVRFIAKELVKALQENFQSESEENIKRVVCYYLYYKYLSPAIIAPDVWNVVEMDVPQDKRENLGKIAKMLQQISTGRSFDEEDLYLYPLNDYVSHAVDRFGTWFNQVLDIEDLDIHFCIDPFIDLTKTQKPTIYISPNEIFKMHALLSQHMNALNLSDNDQLREVLTDLGPCPVSDDAETTDVMANGEISLFLKARTQTSLAGTDSLKQLFMETRRMIVYIMKVQTGDDLLKILMKPVSEAEEELWDEIRLAEFSKDNSSSPTGEKRTRRRSFMSADEVRVMTFVLLKRLALRNIGVLEEAGKVTRDNNFQDMLNSIATTIVNKNRLRAQREAEIPRLEQTLADLEQKRRYLNGQRDSYSSYLETCVKNLSSKSTRRTKFVLPFTRQYFHVRELKRNGKVPKFGSYKYTAKQLYDRGVLLKLADVNPKFFEKISLVISSDEAGVVRIEAHLGGLGKSSAEIELLFNDLLQVQYNGTKVMKLMDGAVEVNVNLLIFLINKKFYV
ncbi:hypothetical protein BZG36_02813 [Bifiguratus adelaidae]|uniref:Ras-GAP domain-containing protein n=1 Tax=Bifiguratus adelaidae TaxID=1938954 RepID=A0A261Y1F9_9FUNG|nr:hypothetical protein BZG36_02813 [Bifiguratus adelaidae]